MAKDGWIYFGDTQGEDIVACPACGGDGSIPRQVADGDFDREPCQMCNMTGSVVVLSELAGLADKMLAAAATIVAEIKENTGGKQMDHRTQLAAIVSLVASYLTDEELATLNLAAHLGTKPRDDIMERALPLYGPDGVMHDETKAALFVVAQARLAK